MSPVRVRVPDRLLEVEVEIRPVPYGLENALPFEEDRQHATYDPDAATRLWRVLGATGRVLTALRCRFTGKASPVQLFWHLLDLAHVRSNGRPAPIAPGGDAGSAEAYSRSGSGRATAL